MLIHIMTVEQTLQSEIQDSKRWIECTPEDSTYKRDLFKRIELINWVLENLKNPDIQICDLVESKMNEIIDKVNETDSVFEADPLHGELRILDWILFVVFTNQTKWL
jgi:hypothetical protein